MTILFNKFGLAGTLSSYQDFPTWNGNGIQGPTTDPNVQVAVGDRANIVTIGNEKALVIKRYAGDPQAGSGYRTELVPDINSHIADWVGEGVGFATIADSIRQYRVCFAIPSTQDITWVGDLTSPSCNLAQIHQISDDTPADTEGLQPTFAIQIRRNPQKIYRLAVLRNIDPNPTTTVANPALHSVESCSWPFSFDTFYDIHVAVKWSYTTLGYLYLYLNRRLIFSSVGVCNTPNNSPARGGGGNYLKLGAYESLDYDFTVLHRGCIVSDGANFAEMYPELPAAQARPLETLARHTSQLAVLS
jgi:hypothetical protein